MPHGFGLSIDDFGTGYSSMQQLALLPFTELKLDRSFVDRCYADPSRLAIIESSIELARKLGLKSVAEGVEDVETWLQLRNALGVRYLSGLLHCPPDAAQRTAALAPALASPAAHPDTRLTAATVPFGPTERQPAT